MLQHRTWSQAGTSLKDPPSLPGQQCVYTAFCREGDSRRRPTPLGLQVPPGSLLPWGHHNSAKYREPGRHPGCGACGHLIFFSGLRA